MSSRPSATNFLVLNSNPSKTILLTKICNTLGQSHWMTEQGQALDLVQNERVHVLLVDASLADHQELQSLPRSVSVLITGDERENLTEISQEWPQAYYVDFHPYPKTKEDLESILHALKIASEHSHLKYSLERKKAKIKKALSEIEEIKTIINDSYVKGQQERISLQSKFVRFRKEKEKIESILKKLYTANDITSFLDIIPDAKDILQAKGISIYLLEQNQSSDRILKPLVWDGVILSHPEIGKYTTALLTKDFAAECAREFKEINCDHVSQDPRLTKRYVHLLDYPLESILCIPILSEDTVIGVIEVYNKLPDESGKKRPFLLEDHRIMRLISEHISIATTKLNLIQYDALTGLLRPDPFFEKIIQTLKLDEMRRQEDASYAIVMGDVDWFKNYNDRNGHEAGNRLLRELSGVMKASIREEDLLCRYGGEEFLFFLTKIEDIEDACCLTERIRQRIEEHYFQHQEHQPRKNLTMSFGVTAFTKNRITTSETITKHDLIRVIREADMALAEAKQKKTAYTSADGKTQGTVEKNRVFAFHKKTPGQTEKDKIIKPYHKKIAVEKRKHKRYYTSALLVYRNSHSPQVTKTVNISLGGTKIATQFEYNKYQSLDLTLILGNKVCQLEGDVIYSKKVKDNSENFHSGLRFKDVSPENRQIMESFFSKLQPEMTETSH